MQTCIPGLLHVGFCINLDWRARLFSGERVNGSRCRRCSLVSGGPNGGPVAVVDAPAKRGLLAAA